MIPNLITLDPKVTGPGTFYKLMIGGIIPRPIAWVSTVSLAGRTNLAPFSFFNGVASNPPSLMFSVARKNDGSFKDTLRNILETREFVVNLASEPQLEVMHATSKEFPYGESEFGACDLKPLPSTVVKPPRVEGSPLQFECRLLNTLDVGTGKGGSTIVVGEIVQAHILEAAWQNGHVLHDVLRPVARLGGPTYALLGKTLDLKRPE